MLYVTDQRMPMQASNMDRFVNQYPANQRDPKRSFFVTPLTGSHMVCNPNVPPSSALDVMPGCNAVCTLSWQLYPSEMSNEL